MNALEQRITVSYREFMSQMKFLDARKFRVLKEKEGLDLILVQLGKEVDFG